MLSKLQLLGDVVLNEKQAPLSTDELVDLARNCAVIVADSRTRGERRLFELSTNLVAFVRGHVDIRNVDVEAASASGVLVARASAGYGPAVAELALGLMIDLSRGITSAAQRYRRETEPGREVGRQLSGSVLGVIGYGHIGRGLCGIAAALGMRVLVFDPHVTIGPDAGIEQVALEELLIGADFLVPLAPAMPETTNLIDAKALRRMKRTAFLINVSRGELVDEIALEAALDAGLIAGAALDVGTAENQMPPARLARRDDVIATPHIGGLTAPAIWHQAAETVEQVADILNGRLPPGAVNGSSAYRLSGGSRRP
ncbi:hypothetical protein AA309_04385 [Microvirga vignae]|uniref:2-hydroxyacid dehydrogenase n=1 Tax=Microvirga vignae TaxID=1225564 RepID=A0A0H1RGJ7_9HYPH|nr:hypothetical protein AA309_04385 [Microvirga vignae]